MKKKLLLQNLIVKEALQNRSQFFTYGMLLECRKEGHVWGITYSTTDIQRRYISVVVSDF
jgi:nitrogen regulatory protein P-II 1